MKKMKAPSRELVMYKINTLILADEMRQSPALEDKKPIDLTVVINCQTDSSI